MTGATLSGTKGLRSNAMTYADRKIIKKLNKLVEIPDIDDFFPSVVFTYTYDTVLRCSYLTYRGLIHAIKYLNSDR